MTGSSSPTVRRRELGSLLRALRAKTGMTVEDVANRLLCSPSKVSRMETGDRTVSRRDIRDLCVLYAVTDQDECQRLAALAEEGRKPAWWQRYNLPPNYATYVGLEAEAIRISDYQPGVVPGLLHSPDYARAIHRASLPRLSDSAIEERIELRLDRQKILTRKDPAPPKFRAIIDEAALHRVVDGPAVMRGQLERVIQATELPNVTVQVLGYEAGAHPALDSKFILLEFTAPVPSAVYVEGLIGHISLDNPTDFDRYQKVFERLQKLAFSERKSVDVLAKVIEEYD